MSEVVGELVGLEEKRAAGHRSLSSPPAGALSGGSLMGVNAEISGRKMVKDFLLRLSDIVTDMHSRSWFANCPNKDLESGFEGTGDWLSRRSRILDDMEIVTSVAIAPKLLGMVSVGNAE